MTKKQAREEVRRRFGAAFDVDKTPHEKAYVVQQNLGCTPEGYEVLITQGRGSTWEEAINDAARKF